MATNNKNKALKKHLTLLCIIFTIVIPFINNFGLFLVLLNIQNDVVFGSLPDLLQSFMSALTTLDLFFTYAILVISIVRFGTKRSSDIIALSAAKIFVTYFSSVLAGAVVTTDFLSSLVKYNYEFFLINALVELMLLLGAVILCGILSTKFLAENNTDITVKKVFDRKNPLIVIITWTTVLISAFLLSRCITDTVADIVTYGAKNLTKSEIIYLIKPYLIWVCKTVFCYFAMVISAKWIDFVWKNLNADDKKDADLKTAKKK